MSDDPNWALQELGEVVGQQQEKIGESEWSTRTDDTQPCAQSRAVRLAPS